MTSFRLIDMSVFDLSLKETEEKTVSGDPYEMKVEGQLDFENDTKKMARLVIFASVHGSEKYILKLEYHFYFQFEEEVTAEQSEELLREARAEVLCYPYVRAFITNVLVACGHPVTNIPLAFSL